MTTELNSSEMHGRPEPDAVAMRSADHERVDIGRAAHGLLVRRQLDGIWAYRRRRIGELIAPALDEPP